MSSIATPLGTLKETPAFDLNSQVGAIKKKKNRLRVMTFIGAEQELYLEQFILATKTFEPIVEVSCHFSAE